MTYLYVAIGGALGACLRWLITAKCELWFGKGMPFGTLAVNVTGSFLLGIVFVFIQNESLHESPYKALLSVGFLGAFTTFSTFSMDTLMFLQHGEWLKAVSNVVLNVFLCILAAAIAVHMVKG